MPLERSFGSVPVCTEFNYKKMSCPLNGKSISVPSKKNSPVPEHQSSRTAIAYFHHQYHYHSSGPNKSLMILYQSRFQKEHVAP
jgi:hypothetical protein